MNIKDSIKNAEREKIYLKYYFSEEMYEEIISNLPNDLLFNIEGFPDNNQLISLMRYVYSAWERNNQNRDGIEFPFAFHFSVVNKWVIEKDKVFEQEYNGENVEHLSYRPFFLEFEGYCNKINFYQLFEFMEMSEKAYLSGFFISDENREAEGYLREGWINGYEIVSILQGNIMSSASPIEFSGGKLVIVKDTTVVDPEYESVLNDSVYRCNQLPYNIGNYHLIESELNKTVMVGKPKIMDVYNVGQACCSSIVLENDGIIFADIGLTKDKIELDIEEVENAKRKIRDITPQIVILSHWDLDHILGVTNASDDIYSATWIVPDLWGLQTVRKNGTIDGKIISDSAKRLLKYLDWKNKDKLIIIGDDLIKKCIYKNPTETISIWTGKRVAKFGENANNKKFYITKSNNFGLIIYIKNNYSALLPGDCEYSVIPDELLDKEINYLMVPHHCSKMSTPKIKASCGVNKAVLSYGIRNKHGHPDGLHMQQIYDEGYQIIPTVGKEKIRLNLK